MQVRRSIVPAALVALIAFPSSSDPADAQTAWPTQNISVQVASAPGGVTDIVARLVWQKLSETMTHPAVFENRSGAGGNLAARMVSTATADGHTILATTTALAINDTASKSKGYATDQLRPVAIVAFTPDIVAVHPSNPAKTLGEFLANAKAKPPTYATAGVATAAHVGAAYLFKELAKVEAAHVPFQGGAPAMTALLGNHVDSLVLAMPVVTPALADGKLRGLGLASARRNAAAPDVPTYAEAGIPNFVTGTWVGFFVPAGTPVAVISRLNEATNEVMKQAPIVDRLAQLGLEPWVRTLSETEAYFKRELEDWGKMVRAVGLAGSS
jgi:tripartite-type tricarboxylate transporter receptor subunit TctC